MPYITSFERLAKEEERRQVIENLLRLRFGDLDSQLVTVVEPLLNLSVEEYTRLLLIASHEELIARFEGRSPTFKSPSPTLESPSSNH